MALRFFDGFDHGDNASHELKYDSGSNFNIVSSPVRTGTGAALLADASSYSASTKALPASGSAVVGFALYCLNNVGQNGAFCYVREGTTTHVRLELQSGKLRVARGDGTALATGTTTLSPNTWYYIELKTTIHDTTGSYELRIDGVTELSASGVDTKNGGTTGQWDRVLFTGLGFGSMYLHIDDLYVCDGSGALNNTFLGAVKVQTLYPQTGNGTNTGLTPSTGTDHGALVDETPANTSDYNSSATVGAKDTYHYPSLTLTGAVLGVQTNLYVSKSDASARTVCAVVRAGGTDYDGANVSPLTSWSYFSEVRETNPATSAAWTSAEIAALEAGMKVTA